MTRILSLFVMFMLCGVVAFSQNRVVTGTVIDEKNLPVEGATISVTGTNNRTAADMNGNFRLANVAPNSTLRVTATGVKSADQNVGTSGNFVIQVTRQGAEGTELAAVTVGALGIRTSAKSLGVSKGTVSQAQLTNGRPVNVAQALSGKVSGLTISNTSASVNASPRIVLRGLRSITGDNTALVVVDGVAVPANIINQLNPNDVDRIDILKGGQAATLFGSDGINGAIVITTKKGVVRKPEINFSTTLNVEKLAYLPKFQHGFGSGSAYGADPSENFHPSENQQYGPAYDGSIRPLGRQLQDGSIQLLPYSDIRDSRKNVWNTGYTRQSDLSYRSGDANNSFFTSFQNLNSNGIVPGDKYERNSIRLNAGKVYNKIGLSFDAGYTFDKADRTNSDYYFFAINSASWVPLDQYADWQNNKFANMSNYYNDYYSNPYWLKDNNRFFTKNYIFNGNVKMDYKATSNLTLTGRVAVAQTNSTTSTTSNNYTFSAFSKTGAFSNYYNNDYDRFLTGLGRNVARTPIQGGDAESQSTGGRLTFDAFATYDKKIKKDLTLRAIVGSQATIRRSKAFAASTASIGVPGLYNFSNSASGLFAASNSQTQQRKIGGFVDLTLGFRDLVFLHGSYRGDYTSVFYDQQAGFKDPYFDTYGGDISVIVSDLIPGIKNKESKVIDNIKLRAAYNVNGNDNLGPNSLRQIYPNATGFPYSGLLGNSVGGTIVDPNLTPEKVTSYEGGVELSLFNSRITLEGSIYQQNADRQLLDVFVSPASGSQLYRNNVGELRNKGYEADLKAIVYRTKNLSVNVAVNYSHNENKVISLSDKLGLNSLQYFETDDRASLNATLGQQFPQLKTTVFLRDAQGKIVIDPTDGWPERANARIGQGSTLPTENIGLGLSVRFKNISFNANAEFRGGAVVYHDLGTDMAFTGSGAITAIYNRQQFIWPNSVYLDGSGKSIPNTNIAVDQYKAIYQGWGDLGFSRGLSGIGEMFVSSADFWKIRDVSVNYDLPASIFANNKIIKGVSFGVFGRNLITWLPKDNWYTDPELSTGFGNANANGINTTINTPPTRQIGASLKVTF